MTKSLYYFFAKAYELLNRNTFDSYRVSLHNPYTIFIELGKAIDKYNKKRIKNFDPTITSIGEEARIFVGHRYTEAVFSFGSFTKKQALDILEDTCQKKKDGRKNRTLSLLAKNIEIANQRFKNNLIGEIKRIVIANDGFKELDVYTSWLLSQLIHDGYSRKFINDQIHRCQKSIGQTGVSECFEKLLQVFTQRPEDYSVLFKLKIVPETQFLPASPLIRELHSFPEYHLKNRYINKKFKERAYNEKYFIVRVKSCDFWSALKTAHQIISETIEINILNESDSKIVLENQALTIHDISNKCRIELIEERLDGYYMYQDEEFRRFIESYKQLKENSVAKEKIRSAIRFYKLGNESIEIEHKILNYWIGFEQLFAAVDSEEDSIKRIKTFFISINCALYIQSRLQYLLQSIERVHKQVELSDLRNPIILSDEFILISERIERYNEWIYNQRAIKKALEIHMKRMDQHITRIYRVRNELVHEGRSESISLFLIAGHLRHYLLFSIEQITNELIENPALDHLDDVFVYYENLVDQIKQAATIQEIIIIKPFQGFMD